jgi:response regulator RpfG family c-di-GMP phosphodiesterase
MDPAPCPDRATILVVDDSPEVLCVMAAVLKDHYNVQVADNGSEALDLIFQAPPNLILMDVVMPEMDGYQACARLKADPLTRDIPVLFLTSLDRDEDEARGFQAGCVDYITKPFRTPLVLARVRTHLEQARLRLVERELVEKTLKGSLALVVEMLAILDPVAFGRARQQADLAERLAVALRLGEPWMVGLAAVLSHIGLLAIPAAILDKVRAQSPLTSAEREVYSRVPEIGYRLLRQIPRLEEVAEVVYYSQKNANGTGFPEDDRWLAEIPLGSRILRVTFDFISSFAAGAEPREKVRDMLNYTAWYDMAVLLALKDLVDQDVTLKLPPVPAPESGPGA